MGKLLKNAPVDGHDFSHQQVVEIAARWLRGRKHGVVLPEFVHMGSSEICDVLGFTSRHTTMIEVKVSRRDFLADKKKHFRYFEEKGMGNYRYYCVPHKLVGVLEIPEGWGLIYIYPTGKAREMLAPEHKTSNLQAERGVLYSYARRANVKGHHADIMKTIKQEAEEANLDPKLGGR